MLVRVIEAEMQETPPAVIDAAPLDPAVEVAPVDPT